MSQLEQLLKQQEELAKQIAEALKTVKRLCKQFGFTAGMLKGSLAEGRKAKEKYHLLYRLILT